MLFKISFKGLQKEFHNGARCIVVLGACVEVLGKYISPSQGPVTLFSEEPLCFSITWSMLWEILSCKTLTGTTTNHENK